MLLAIKIGIVVVLGLIFFQDMKSRAVMWFLFPLLAVLLSGIYYFQYGVAGYPQLVGFNIGFIVVQMVLVSVWFSIRNKRWVNITSGQLGWGDILFVLCLCFCFSTANFILFYIGSLIAVLLIWIIGREWFFKNNPHIPLAGLQAIILLAVLIFSWIKPNVQLTSDNWLIASLS